MSTHDDIMNITCPPAYAGSDVTLGYKLGHRDARHAAASLANASDREIEQLKDSIRAIAVQWERQKNLFPVLQQDGWMDLAIKDAMLSINKK